MCLVFNKYFLCFPLEEVAVSPVSFIIIFCITYIYLHHEFYQSTLNEFGNEQVIVVFHETPSMDLHQSFPMSHIRIANVSTSKFWRRGSVVEFIQIMNKSS